MLTVAKQKPDPEPADPKRYPSREKTRYVAVPAQIHEALKEYARKHSDQDDEKSISWAARRLLREALERAGLWPPKSR